MLASQVFESSSGGPTAYPLTFKNHLSVSYACPDLFNGSLRSGMVGESNIVCSLQASQSSLLESAQIIYRLIQALPAESVRGRVLTSASAFVHD